VLAILLSGRAYQDIMAYDFHRSFRPAAEAVLNGNSPYPPPLAESMAERAAFVYLPLAAFLFTPFLLLSPIAGDLVVTARMFLLVLAALRIMGFRDWRCYGIAILSPALISAIQTANLTLPLLWRSKPAAEWAERPIGCYTNRTIFTCWTKWALRAHFC
jgi:hypothetical protein